MSRWKGLLAIVVIAGFIPIIAFFEFGFDEQGNLRHSQPSSAPSSSVHLSAKVVRLDDGLLLSNNDDFDWTDVQLRANPGFISGGFTKRLERITAHQTVSIDLRSFSADDGSRFNPDSMVVKELHVSSSTPHGDGYTGWRWE